MDFLKKQLARLKEQFALLTATQKMLAVSLIAIMVMTLLWWGNYAGESELEEVLAQDFSADDLARVTSQLQANQITFKVNGARVMVPHDRKVQAQGILSYSQLMPHDMSSAFEDTISKMSSPIDPPSKTDSIQNHAREVMLAQWMRYWPKVRSAMVAIDPSVHRSFDNSVMPSATVMIQLNTGEKPDKKLVMAAADAVVGSVAGLERNRVKVIVDGAPQVVEDGDLGDMTGNLLMDRIREWETYYSRKVQDHLAIDGAMVHVAVALNDEHTQMHVKGFDPKATIKAERSTSSHTEEATTVNHAGSSDPGVNANGPISIPNNTSPPAEQNRTSSEESKTDFDNNVGTTDVWKTKAAGAATVRSVSVSLPRSYFAKIYQRNMGTDKEPTKAVLDPFIDEQLLTVRRNVRGCLPVDTDDMVVLTTYTDLLPVNPEASGQVSGGVSLLIGGHMKEIALGALALVSLFMVSTMVRKAAPVIVTPEDASADVAGKGKSGKGAAEDDTAEVGEGAASLDGVELDKETIHNQQMADQVTTLVKENPDAAAMLVKRWMNRA